MGRFSVPEGRGDKALLLVRSDNKEATCQRLATAGKAAVDAEQSSEEAVIEWCRDKEANPRGAVMIGCH
jgi:hypothetical protein